MTLALGFRLEHREDLGTGIHQFCLEYPTSAVRKVLKAHANQHHFIAGGGSAPTLADTAYLTAPDGPYFPKTAAMARSAHTCLWVIQDNLQGRYHPSTQGMYAVVLSLMDQDNEFEEYYPCNPSLKTKLSTLLTRWIQTCLFEWITRQ